MYNLSLSSFLVTMLNIILFFSILKIPLNFLSLSMLIVIVLTLLTFRKILRFFVHYLHFYICVSSPVFVCIYISMVLTSFDTK
ncbi:hypothetical protein F5878DRAFT_51548 [Lentinula raphanica]|uniref:Uncharacterized protein n=1 Tax=Lentinula raphanica TaxID=153919 RepID=A0AA38PD90_9AGAR|nr:hypothetical protein F5878DRAFT_51548 [Lentinula raphanica]